MIEKDHFGVRNILVWVINSVSEWSSLTSPVSLWQAILATSCFEERRKQVIHNSVFLNVISMTKRASVARYYAQCKTPLHIFEWGNVSLERYFREVILGHVLLFRCVIIPEFLFMDNTEHPHRNPRASNILESEDINCMLAYSLDLNFIQHVCDALSRRVYK